MSLYSAEHDHAEQPFLDSSNSEKGTEGSDATKRPTKIGTRIIFQRKYFIYTIALLLLSLSLNVFLVVRRSPTIQCGVPAQTRPSYTGLEYDTPVVYRHHNDWWSSNQTIADELWENLDTDPMVVQLGDEWAEDHGLPESRRFAWDDKKGRYHLKLFHQLHCLKYIRRTVADYQRGSPQVTDGIHVHHCLASLRQDITCAADDTLMPANLEDRSIGDGQVMMCRNYDKLVAWAYAPERHACHKSISDYKSIIHPRERYAYCPKWSEYYGKMIDWFAVHGHRDPFG